MQTTQPSTLPHTESVGTAMAIFDALINTTPGRFVLLALVLGFVTQGVKKVAAPEGSAKKAILMATPALIGAPVGLVPGFYPNIEIGIAVLLCAVAGVCCVYVFDLWSGVADHLKVRALEKANAKIDEVVKPPAVPPVVGS